METTLQLKRGTSPRFNMSRGVRQDCPISHFLFLIATRILAYYLNSSALQGITVAGRQFIICQLTGNTTLLLKDESQVSVDLNTIKMFSEASGLHLNMTKREIMYITMTINKSSK